jgi:hypothetical protein
MSIIVEYECKDNIPSRTLILLSLLSSGEVNLAIYMSNYHMDAYVSLVSSNDSLGFLHVIVRHCTVFVSIFVMVSFHPLSLL